MNSPSHISFHFVTRPYIVKAVPILGASVSAASPHDLSDVPAAITTAVISVISPNFAAGISKELAHVISTTITNTFTDISHALGLTITSSIAIPNSSGDAGTFQNDDDQW